MTAQTAIPESITEPSLFDQFYSIEISDDDLLEMGMLLESVHVNLGAWFLDHDEEFQKDILAGSKLFWEKRKGLCKCDSSKACHPSDEIISLDPLPSKTAYTEPAPNGQRRRRKPSLGTGPLAALRVARGFSQKRLAELVGASQSTICRLEIGDFVHPFFLRDAVRARLEEIFAVPIKELVVPKKASKGPIEKLINDI